MTIGQVVALAERAWPPHLAESWDTGIGLSCGDRDRVCQRILLALDVTDAVVTDAIEAGVDLLLTHHPILFRAVQSVAADTAKGRLIHRLIRADIAHLGAHTNADRAAGGVNDALATAIGLTDIRPLVPAPRQSFQVLVVYVPTDHADQMCAALCAAGAGAIGNYTEAAFRNTGIGQFRPGLDAQPAIGTCGELEHVQEIRLEMVVPNGLAQAVISALRQVHPYEEPAFHLLEPVAEADSQRGLGRIGTLATACTLAEFTQQVAAALPTAPAGVRAGGDPHRMISTVAVCGGSGVSQLSAATAAGVDVYLSADLDYHRAQEHLADPTKPALVDAGHWATEAVWLPTATAFLREHLPGSVEVLVNVRCTDPWTLHVGPQPKEK